MYIPKPDDEIIQAITSYTENMAKGRESAVDISNNLRAFADLLRCSALYGKPLTVPEILDLPIGSHVVVFDPHSLTTHVSEVTAETKKIQMGSAQDAAVVTLKALKGMREHVFGYQVFQCGGRKKNSN